MTYKSFIFLSILCAALTLSPAANGNSVDNKSSLFGAVGSEWGAVLIVSEQQKQTDGFRLYSRSLMRDRFSPSAFFIGLPQSFTLSKNRLWIIFENGNVQSYTLSVDTMPQPEASLPPGLRACSFISDEEHLYILAQVKPDQNVSIPFLSADRMEKSVETNSSTSDVSAPPSSDSEPIAFSSGEYLILQSMFNSQWRCIHRVPLSLSPEQTHSLSANENQITVFSLSKSYRRDESFYRDIQLHHLKNGSLEPQTAVPQKNLVAISPFLLNRRLVLLEAITPEPIPQNINSDQPADLSHVNFRLAYPAPDEWAYTPLLNYTADSILAASLSQVRFAPFGQNLLAIQKHSAKEFFWGVYSPEGESLIPLQRKIQAFRHVPTQYWFQRYESSFPLMIAILLIIFWKRREAFGMSADSVPPVPPASLWRRAVAFILDFLPANIAAMLIFSDSLEWILNEQRLALTTQEGIYPLGFIKLYALTCLFLIVYQTLFEIALGTTPGKMALSLRVCDISGKRASKKQILLRNLTKFLELHHGVIFMILVTLVVTRFTQRPGDLLARTFVTQAPSESDVDLHSADRKNTDSEN